MKDTKQNLNWNQTLLNEVEVWSSMKIMRKKSTSLLPPLPAFFCSRAAAVFRQGFISPKIGIYPVSMYQERKTTTPVWNFGLQLCFLRVWRAPFVSVSQTRRKWSWSQKFWTGKPNFTVSHFPALFLPVWQTRRNEACWTQRNKAGTTR